MLPFVTQFYPLIALLNEVKVNKSTLKGKERDGFLINNVDLIQFVQSVPKVVGKKLGL